jgi:hypothetical protein
LPTTSPLNSTLPTQTLPSFTSTPKTPLTTTSPKKPLSSKPSTNATNKFNKNHSKSPPGSNNSKFLKINSKNPRKNTKFKPDPSKNTNSNTKPWKNSNLNMKFSLNLLKNSKLILSNPKTSSKTFQKNFFPKMNKSNSLTLNSPNFNKKLPIKLSSSEARLPSAKLKRSFSKITPNPSLSSYSFSKNPPFKKKINSELPINNFPIRSKPFLQLSIKEPSNLKNFTKPTLASSLPKIMLKPNFFLSSKLYKKKKRNTPNSKKNFPSPTMKVKS